MAMPLSNRYVQSSLVFLLKLILIKGDLIFQNFHATLDKNA